MAKFNLSEAAGHQVARLVIIIAVAGLSLAAWWLTTVGAAWLAVPTFLLAICTALSYVWIVEWAFVVRRRTTRRAA